MRPWKYSMQPRRVKQKEMFIVDWKWNDGIVDESRKKHEEQAEEDFVELEKGLMRYAWHYYVLKQPLIPNEKYDELKCRYIQLAGLEKTGYQRLRDAVRYLQENEIEYIDKTDKGGCLYFRSKSAYNHLKKEGFQVHYLKKGTRATEHKSTYYLKLKDN